MLFIDSVHRAAVVGVFITLASTLSRLEAQGLAVPDSTVVYMTSPALFQLVDFEIAAAALGRHYVIKVDVPEGLLWSRVASHLLKATNGRVPTPSDSVFTAVAIKDIRFASDTLVATLVKETRQRCPGNRWMSTGTDYEVRTLRVKGVSDGWTAPAVTPGSTWDALVAFPHADWFAGFPIFLTLPRRLTSVAADGRCQVIRLNRFRVESPAAELGR